MKVYCKSCKKPTEHRQKLGGTVCNSCDVINYPVYLERINDGRSNIGNTAIWIEWTDDGRGKASHPDPRIGYSLCLDPYVIKPDFPGLEDHITTPGYGWLTTSVTEIIEDKKIKSVRQIHFKTKNSEYILHYSTPKS
jgi:hypothetical protein